MRRLDPQTADLFVARKTKSSVSNVTWAFCTCVCKLNFFSALRWFLCNHGVLYASFASPGKSEYCISFNTDYPDITIPETQPSRVCSQNFHPHQLYNRTRNKRSLLPPFPCKSKSDSPYLNVLRSLPVCNIFIVNYFIFRVAKPAAYCTLRSKQDVSTCHL